MQVVVMLWWRIWTWMFKKAALNITLRLSTIRCWQTKQKSNGVKRRQPLAILSRRWTKVVWILLETREEASATMTHSPLVWWTRAKTYLQLTTTLKGTPEALAIDQRELWGILTSILETSTSCQIMLTSHGLRPKMKNKQKPKSKSSVLKPKLK